MVHPTPPGMYTFLPACPRPHLFSLAHPACTCFCTCLFWPAINLAGTPPPALDLACPPAPALLLLASGRLVGAPTCARSCLLLARTCSCSPHTSPFSVLAIIIWCIPRLPVVRAHDPCCPPSFDVGCLFVPDISWLRSLSAATRANPHSHPARTYTHLHWPSFVLVGPHLCLYQTTS
jgi:hypothetical protein